MYGLIVLGAMLLYVIVCIGFVSFVKRLAARRYPQHKRLAGWLALLLFNAPLLYETVPAMLAQPWYCARESGFWLYTSPEEWKAKYPGVAETLEPIKITMDIDRSEFYEVRQLGRKHQQRIYHLNPRFDWVIDIREWPHNLYRTEETVVDTATGEVMARDIDFFRRGLDWFGPPGTNDGCYRKEDFETKWSVDGRTFYDIQVAYENIGGKDEDE